MALSVMTGIVCADAGDVKLHFHLPAAILKEGTKIITPSISTNMSSSMFHIQMNIDIVY